VISNTPFKQNLFWKLVFNYIGKKRRDALHTKGQAMDRFKYDKRDLEFLKDFRQYLRPIFENYFRVDYHGVKDLEGTPSLFVGNHNGIFSVEILMMLEIWARELQFKFPGIFGLTHDMVFNHAVLKHIVPKIGCIPANPDIAKEAFKHGHSLLVYPGGEFETFRPLSEKSEVQFSGRKGFARLALEADVPIIPVANVGGHEQSLVLYRDEEIAKMRDFKKKFRVSAIPITPFGIPFIPGLFSKYTEKFAFYSMIAFSSFPMPAKMDFYFEKPIKLTEEEKHKKTFDQQVDLLNQKVLDSLQYRLTREYSRPRVPLYGEVEARGLLRKLLKMAS
jgi:1-acyl-sn-glycerol-3-phosphate acyltransferase